MERARVSETRGRRHGGVGLLDRKSEQISGAVELFSLVALAITDPPSRSIFTAIFFR
jgi:hypothetical protein